MAFWRRVNIALRDCDATVTRHLLNRESIRASFTKPCQERAAKRVYHAVRRKLQMLLQLLILPQFTV